MSADAGYGANTHKSVKKTPNPQCLKRVLQGDEVEMPKLGGALIASVEKPFPEWEAGRMDPVGWSNTGTLPFLLLPAFPFFAGPYLLFHMGYNFLVGTRGCGRGKEMTLAFFTGLWEELQSKGLALRAR